MYCNFVHIVDSNTHVPISFSEKDDSSEAQVANRSVGFTSTFLLIKLQYVFLWFRAI